VHGDHVAGVEIAEGVEGFFGVHVDLAAAHGFVGADGEDGEVDGGGGTDFGEAVEVGAVAAVEDGAAGGIADEEAAEAAVDIVDHAGTPVFGGGEGDFERADAGGGPVLHFDDSAEAGAADEFTDACGDDDGLALADAAEAAEVEVVEVGVADEDGVDGWEVVDFEAWVAYAFDEAEPVGPDGVDEDVEALGLEEEGGVADPCDLEVGAVVAEEVGAVRGSAAEGEELGEEDAACEVVVASGPALLGEEADALAFGGAGSDDGEGGVGWGEWPLGVWLVR